MEKSSPIIVLHANDDVAIARRKIAAGEVLDEAGLTAAEDIPLGHKIARRDVAAGNMVKRYNQGIGLATRAIRSGEHVHLQNLGMGDFQKDYAFCEEYRPVRRDSEIETFLGFRRENGKVGTRNDIGILISVNCAATAARMIADHFRMTGLADFPNVGRVVPLTHSLGCAVGGGSEHLEMLRRTLAGYVRQPNFGGVVMIGLGCETNQIADLIKSEGLEEGPLFRTMTIQETGGTGKTIAKGIAAIEEMLPLVNRIRREPIPLSELVVALECGGSDSCSGISANPVVGYAVDRLVRQGGTAILSETPEIYGAEHLLTRRAASRQVGEKLLERFRWWEDYCQRGRAEMNNNPSAGNKVGGLTTILEKSLGAVSKGGSTSLNAVYEYAEPVKAHGLVFMDTPGYDPYAATGQIAGGANLMCFTTGRGSAFGSAPVPSIKLASNNALWQRQGEDMDLNCGGVMEGTDSIESLGEELFRLMLRVASGDASKSERFGYGDTEFAPWSVGAIM
ncbi:UxaA family hydrolase [Telmatospirillum siberiense]|uniref:Galactonate dehydratase n=1 Tax=Telmatospirillum siberiense TaxID=382514 RepID=A0A2N3PM56_9PROT|nr:altronate dehydratase family protein [Telmatospirillum siberiense]PKU21470.1 galactonate dehydratase [Telmatospirillum siberiense]